jgi:uncharacterized membrane protein YphA (DoxX/SURF4 family)
MILAALELVLAALFLCTGLAKLLRHPHMVREFRRFDYPYGLALLAGAMELVGAVLLVAGLWLPQLSAAGSALLLAVMLGATYTNFVKRPLAYGLGMLVLVALAGIPLWAALTT